MISVYFEEILSPPFNIGVLRLYVLNEARKISTEMKRDFDRTVSTWDQKPRFSKDVNFGKDKLSIEVGTDDVNYRRVSEGTTGKPRVARGWTGVGGAKAIKLVPYIPKTVPGQIDARAGGEVEGGTIVYRAYTLNTGGIKARGFDELIQEIWEPKFAERLQVALDAAAVSTGFAF